MGERHQEAEEELCRYQSQLQQEVGSSGLVSCPRWACAIEAGGAGSREAAQVIPGVGSGTSWSAFRRTEGGRVDAGGGGRTEGLPHRRLQPRSLFIVACIWVPKESKRRFCF